MSLKYELRLYDHVTKQGEEDRSFWLDAWLKSYKKSDWAGVCPNHLFFDLHRMVIEDLLERGAQIWMVVLPGEPNTFMGFLCTEDYKGTGKQDTVHYLYIKEPWRRNNLGSQVLNEVVGKKFAYTFRTKYCNYARKDVWSMSFEPERVRRKKA